MFGFLKRKKKDKEAQKEKKEEKKEEKEENGAPDEKTDPPVKKKRFPLKLIIIILAVLIAVAVSGFVVYKFWFSAKPDAEDVKPVYEEIELAHVDLPEEMVKFSFDHFPELYDALITFNREMELFEAEIARIDEIAARYPDQKKITDKEKKVWVKTKESLKKSFIKIEKPVKETYVLFRVNKEAGLLLIKEKNKELTEAAQTALIPAQEMTQKLKQMEKAPDGLIKGTVYKLKKKFL